MTNTLDTPEPTPRNRRRATAKKDPKSGTWTIVVDDPHDPATGKRKQLKRRGFKTQKLALAELDKIRHNVREGDFVALDRTNVRKYLTAWLDSLERSGLRANTIASYRRVITHHVVPYLGSRPLQSLTALDLDRLYSELLTDGARVDGKPGGLSPRSVRYAHTLISKALSEAEQKGIVPRNVARAATPPSASSARAREMSTWTPTELDAFLESMATHPLFPILRLAAMTGMRRGELCGLRWSDLDLDRGILSVARTVTTKSYDLIVNSPKTPRSRRTIDLDAKTISVLQAWRKVQVAQQLQAGPRWADCDGYVFTRSDGALVHPNTVGKAFDRGVRASGLPRIRLHDLRHTHATQLLAAGVNAKIVSERLGHSSVAFTLDRYAHVIPGQQAEAAAAVAALVDGAVVTNL